ncbi:MAG: CoA transferase subunit A [Pseudomonadota bacterium]
MSKVYQEAAAALDGLLRDGMTIMAGGFGLCGIPENLLAVVAKSGVRDLTVISNNAGIDGKGLGVLMEGRQIRKMIASYIGENKCFEQMYLKGEVQVEFTPQGTLAERCRAGGSGIPAFYTATGAGTPLAEGKQTATFDGRDYILERALTADLALVKAWKGDALGNLRYRKTARNFNPAMAMGGTITIAEVEEMVPVGAMDCDDVHTPGIFVQRLIKGTDYEKAIENLTTREA